MVYPWIECYPDRIGYWYPIICTLSPELDLEISKLENPYQNIILQNETTNVTNVSYNRHNARQYLKHRLHQLRRNNPHPQYPITLPNARRNLLETFPDLLSTLQAPDPTYDTAEKPWLPGPQKPYLIHNARLVDPRAGIVHKNMSLHLARGKVVKVAPTTEKDTTAEFHCGGQKVVKIDARGYFVCPGLIDCHVHLMAVHGSATLHGAFTFPHETAVLRSAGTMRAMLSNGFTAVRDTGGASIAHALATDEPLHPGPAFKSLISSSFFFFNYLDRAAFANAYVAGLSDSLSLEGNQYNVLLSMTTAGYVIGQIPHGIAIQNVPPRIWFPTMCLIWAVLTGCSAACKTYAQLCVIRFLQGPIEVSTYCGTIYCIGSWYKPREIAKRTSIFTASGQAGQMFAGMMMTAIHSGMDGYAGLQGWQWVFIIDGIITCPIAVMGYLYFLDVPEHTKARWMSESEKRLALERLPPKKKDGLTSTPGRSPNASSAARPSTSSASSHVEGSFTQTQVNTYPLGIQAMGIVSNMLAAIYVDATGQRVPMGILACGLQLISTIILLVPSSGWCATMFAFYLAGSSFIVNPLLFGWATIICQGGGDDARRSVILTSMNPLAQILYTFWGIALFLADVVPYWRNGYITARFPEDASYDASNPAALTEAKCVDAVSVNEKDVEKELISTGKAADAVGATPVTVA
ncbi:major facilitator superfamily domain-containing protein [Aspergillus desertorum]